VKYTEYDLEYLPELGTVCCTRCGKLNVRLRIALKSLLKDQTLSDRYQIKEVVEENGNLHYCDILDIKNTVNFSLESSNLH
jgi:hypothetical protein